MIVVILGKILGTANQLSPHRRILPRKRATGRSALTFFLVYVGFCFFRCGHWERTPIAIPGVISSVRFFLTPLLDSLLMLPERTPVRYPDRE